MHDRKEPGSRGGLLTPQFCGAATPAAEPQRSVLLPCAPEQGEDRQRPQDLQPPPPPGPQVEGQEKSGGDEGPASEPLFKVLDTPLSEGEEPTTLPAQRDHGHSVQMEGYLGRKHDLEGPNKKASNRCVGRGRRRRVGGRGVRLQGLHRQSLGNTGACAGGEGTLCFPGLESFWALL